MSAGSETPEDRLRDLLEQIATAVGVEADVEIRDEAGVLVAEYLGDDVAVLIGRHGQTIDAIQHLAYRIATRGERERASVTVDAEGYRERRAVALRQAADQAASIALAEDRAIALDPMGALERKVIHEHLKGRCDIETYSEGQEPARHLVVAPVVPA